MCVLVGEKGRTAHLLITFLLGRPEPPPAVIRKEDRRNYVSSIEKAQLGGSRADYYALLYEAVDRSLDIYLDAAKGKEQEHVLQKKPFLKIGDLAKLTDETVPTIRHWTREGLLAVAEYTRSGYQLYNQDAVKAARKIRTLQNAKRLTLAEIKAVLVQ